MSHSLQSTSIQIHARWSGRRRFYPHTIHIFRIYAEALRFHTLLGNALPPSNPLAVRPCLKGKKTESRLFRTDDRVLLEGVEDLAHSFCRSLLCFIHLSLPRLLAKQSSKWWWYTCSKHIEHDNKNGLCVVLFFLCMYVCGSLFA